MHSLLHSLSVSVHIRVQCPEQTSLPLLFCFFIAHRPMHTVSYYLSFLFYSVSALPLHTHLQSLQKLLQKWVTHYCFLLPRLFIYIFANEEMVELVREKPLTQFPVRLLEVCLQRFYQSIQMEKKKVFLMMAV